MDSHDRGPNRSRTKSEQFAASFNGVSQFFSNQIKKHGACAKGVDWRDEASQELRFKRLLANLPIQNGSSMNDLGCGYGALKEYIDLNKFDLKYHGFDISAEMIDAARKRFHSESSFTMLSESDALPEADFGVCSGIFNLRLEIDDNDWRDYIYRTIHKLNQSSRVGFSFNMLTSYSDHDKMRPDLYYSDPAEFFDYAKKKLSRFVTLDHGYNLYEFTLTVLRNGS